MPYKLELRGTTVEILSSPEGELTSLAEVELAIKITAESMQIERITLVDPEDGSRTDVELYGEALRRALSE